MHQPQGFLSERIRHPEVAPLELSDACVLGATLWEWSQGPGFGSALRAALEELRAGGGAIQSGKPIPAVVAGYEAVFVTGGRAANEEIRAELSTLTCPVLFAEDLVFSAMRGGFELLEKRKLDGWVADLGKSQLKLAAPGWHSIFPRDWSRLRAGGQVPPAELPAQRRRLREFIASALQIGMVETSQRPNALVFALPTRLADDGIPSSSSYAGMRDDRMLLPDALELSGLAGARLFVINDAELAAVSARLDARMANFRKVLVLTLGFGIGAAMIRRSE